MQDGPRPQPSPPRTAPSCAHRPVEAVQQALAFAGPGVLQGGNEPHVQHQLAGDAEEGCCGRRDGDQLDRDPRCLPQGVHRH